MSNASKTFNCTQCGACCSNITLKRGVLLNSTDIDRLSNYLKKSKNQIILEYLLPIENELSSNKTLLYSLRPDSKGKCKFLSEDNKCEVHPAKPHQCEHMPLMFFSHLTNPDVCPELDEKFMFEPSTKYDKVFIQGIATDEEKGKYNGR